MDEFLFESCLVLLHWKENVEIETICFEIRAPIKKKKYYGSSFWNFPKSGGRKRALYHSTYQSPEVYIVYHRSWVSTLSSTSPKKGGKYFSLETIFSIKANLEMAKKSLLSLKFVWHTWYGNTFAIKTTSDNVCLFFVVSK